MAFRIASHVVAGEIDNRVRGRVTGQIELTCGVITLNLVGNCHPDVAGTRFRFRNPCPAPATPDDPSQRLDPVQEGMAGEITASRRVKELLVSEEDFLKLDEQGRKKAFRWANSLHLEWFSHVNGRIVVEGTGFEVEILDGPEWSLSGGEEVAGQAAVTGAFPNFFDQAGEGLLAHRALSDEEEQVPGEEAEMDRHMKRMDLLARRIARRLEKEGPDGADWSRIYHEESARLRRERGEPEPKPLTPEQEEERRQWIEEINAAAEEAADDAGADAWKEEERKSHPLALKCRDLTHELMNDPHIPESAHMEHPLAEIRDGVMIASGKLAGGLGSVIDFGDWPPGRIEAPVVLTFLKKARSHLRDALMGMDAADDQNLVRPEWRQAIRARITEILVETQRLIEEAREVLSNEEEDF